MKKIFLLAVASVVALGAAAQETYESANITDTDLNGTARYVGMGGAMEALGADISTISTNPAGIGLFRKSQVSVSGGLQVVEGQPSPSDLDGHTTTGSFDQIGAVMVWRTGVNSYLNFGFNYHKSKNFNQVLSAVGSLDAASQSKNAYFDGMEPFTQVSQLYNNVLNGGTIDKRYVLTDYYTANGYDMLKVAKGYTGSYDFNVSGNIHDRLYLGLTLGIKEVNYHQLSSYLEYMSVGGDMELIDERWVDGAGFDFTLGAIWRPVASSPFRVGVSIATPTFYSLTTSNYTSLFNNTNYGYADSGNADYEYDFRLNTPWKYGISVGHTVGNYLALGASYEFADYNNLDNRVIRDTYYYDEYNTSDSDKRMNRNTKASLKGVSTFKVGAECKVLPELSVRMGYNYVSPKYSIHGYKDGTIDSWGSDAASQTDYVNWKATNRITLGVGYNCKKWSFDLAYQYSAVNGEFHPFMDSTLDAPNISDLPDYAKAELQYDDLGAFLTNYADAVKVKNMRHQLLATISYRF